MINNKIVNLGCRLNIYEGEIIKNHLKNENLDNVTIINSCAVAEEEKKVSYEIRKAKKKILQIKLLSQDVLHKLNQKNIKN